MSKKDIKNATLSVRVTSEVKDFFLEHRGLSSRVLENFYIQYKALDETKKMKIKKNNRK